MKLVDVTPLTAGAIKVLDSEKPMTLANVKLLADESFARLVVLPRGFFSLGDWRTYQGMLRDKCDRHGVPYTLRSLSKADLARLIKL